MIGRLLAHKPTERPASAALALEQLGPAEPPSRRGALAAAAALLLSTGAGLAIALLPDPPAPKPPAVVVADEAPVLGPMKPELTLPLPEEQAQTSTPAIDVRPPEPQLQVPGPKPGRAPTKAVGKGGTKPKAAPAQETVALPQAAEEPLPFKVPLTKKPKGKPRPKE